jgi:hypothetical protein
MFLGERAVRRQGFEQGGAARRLAGRAIGADQAPQLVAFRRAFDRVLAGATEGRSEADGEAGRGVGAFERL